jgi:DtxR family Mn-dependent transcriptional regulator
MLKEENKTAKLTKNVEDYLKAILVIGKEKTAVRIKDISHRLQVKMPSAVAMMKSLSERDLVRHEHYGYIELTPKGLHKAKDVHKRHKTLFSFLHDFLGVEEKKAEEDACGMEHYISKESLNHLLKFIEFVETCPAGEPLWFSSFHYFMEKGVRPERCIKECIKEGEDIVLSGLKVGQKAKITRVVGDSNLKRKLLGLGIVPGITIELEKIAPQSIDIVACGRHLILNSNETKSIFVGVV